MENCAQGHPILQDQGTCEHGHPAVTTAPAAPVAGQQPDPVAMVLQTQQMMQATMQQLLQNLNLATPNPTQPHPRCMGKATREIDN